jgi:hypothetical protein
MNSQTFTVTTTSAKLILSMFEPNGWIVEVNNVPRVVFAKNYLSAVRAAGYKQQEIVSISF